MRQGLILCLVVLGLGFQLNGQYTLNLIEDKSLGSNQVYASGVFEAFTNSDYLIRLGQFERALIALDEIIATYPNHVESYIKRAQLNFQLGRIEAGNKDLTTAKRMNPMVTQFLMAKSAGAMKRWMDYNEEEFLAVLDESNQPYAYAQLVESLEYKANGQYDQALWTLEKLQEDLPADYGMLHALNGHIRLLLNDYDGATQAYSRAIRMMPDHSTHYFHRGIAQLHLYQRISACNDLEISDQLGYAGSSQKLAYFCYH